MPENSIRIDKLLFFLRLAKSRSLAAIWADAGHIRVNGQRVERSSFVVKLNDVVTLLRGQDVLVIRVLLIPPRRGPPSEAQICYTVLP